MRRNGFLHTWNWALYAVALFFIYHLVIKVAFIELSWIALLLFLPLLGLIYFLIRPEERRQVIVFTIGFLMLDRAFTRLDMNSIVTIVVGGTVAAVVIALLAKWYGRLTWTAVSALVAVAVLFNAGFNRDNLAVWNHFTIQWESDKLYRGNWVDYFPITLYDVDQDGKQEIITYGNADELPLEPEADEPKTEEERKALAEKLLPLKAEPVSLYVMTWKDGQLVRMPNEQIPADTLARIREQLPADFPGFPYYTMKDGQLVPNVQRQSYAEAMLQAGTAPYRAFLLDMQNIEEMLRQNGGKMDARTSFGDRSKFRDLSIQGGLLTGTYDGKPFATETKATKLIDTMTLPDGREGLLVLGEHLSVLAVEPDGTVTERYALSRKQVPLATAKFILADIDKDNTDEMLVASTPSYILKPKPDGTWEILWASQEGDKAFSFTNYATVGENAEPEIIAQAKSWVSTTHQLRYLAGFRYTPEGLEQTWKVYLPLMNVQVGDIDGDKQNEIVATIYDKHRLLVLKQHNLPVLPLVIALFIGLLGYGVVRRFRHA
jgi:hypothetical protein